MTDFLIKLFVFLMDFDWGDECLTNTDKIDIQGSKRSFPPPLELPKLTFSV